MRLFAANRAAGIAFRVAGALIAAALLCAVTVGSVLAYPQPLFPHRMEQGRLQLLSDIPFDRAAGQRLLSEVERRLAASPIKPGGETHRIVIAQAQWRRRLVFLWKYRAGGLNYYPLRNVFLREADIAGDRLLRKSGAVPPPRTLAYYAAHEIGHSLIGQRIGALANWRLPKWIREGVADYIGFGGNVDIEALTAALYAGDRELDPVRSGFYARYRLLVAWMLQHEGWSIDRLLTSGLTQAEAEARLLRWTHDRQRVDHSMHRGRNSAGTPRCPSIVDALLR